MAPTHIRTTAIARFECLGSACPDTCCQGWGMQVTPETINKLTREAPELLAAITTGEAQSIMKRDPVNDQCVKLDAGWCAIHRDYGQDFLGEACRFFPRITRALSDTIVTTGALSCPELARLMLYTDEDLTLTDRTEVTVPYTIKNYLPAELSADEALTIHQSFLAVARDETVSAEHAMMRLSATARAIEMQPVSAWKDAIPFYLTMADGRIPPAEASAIDLYNLLHALNGLVMGVALPRPRLLAIIDAISDGLGVTFAHGGSAFTLAPDAAERGVILLARMRAQHPTLTPVLRRYIGAQLSQGLFPFGGFGGTLRDRITILGVRLATVKLALATLDENPATEQVIAIIQTLSRFMDHLADATLSLQIYHETGWHREARLRGLLGDA